MSTTLQIERETFANHLAGFLREGKQGKFVLIDGGDVHGVWTSIDEALGAGYRKFELEPFLIKLVTEHEEPVYFSRNVR